MTKKRKDYEFYTTVDDKGQIQMHDRTAEIAAKHAPPPIPEAQLEAWKKAPKEQALKEALELFRAQGIDVTEARFKLDVLRFISDLQGASAPAQQGSAAPIMIIINQPGSPQKRIVNVTPSEDTAEKKEDAPP